MQDGQRENEAFLRGEVVTAPGFSHRNHGREYGTFCLAVRRFSGVFDRLNVIAPMEMLDQCPLTLGDTVQVRGEVRSYNNRTGEGSRLVITVYARAIDREGEEHENRLVLSGALCKKPVLRRTPLGRDICDLLLAVNRKYGRADYLPCIAWGALARKCAARDVGERIRLTGRLQSRGYIKKLEDRSEERVAYEVSIMQLSEGEDEAHAGT